VVKVIWQKGRIAAAHGGFGRIRQVAPVCTPSNRRFLRPTRVQRHLDWFSRFCTAQGRRYLYFTLGHLFPLKISLVHGEPGPLSNACFLIGLTPLSIPKGISIGSAVFAQLTAESFYTW